MKNVLRFTSLIFLQLLCIATAHGISATTTNTASICYNDGTLTIHASGGNPPYTYIITSGPANPNINYPIVLPLGDNTFTDLPHGSYIFTVIDALGSQSSFAGVVAGIYEFPTMTLSSVSDSIIADASLGLPPYQYSLSTTSANSGFGAYQASNIFSDLCQGYYWVRVRDSCQNIYSNGIYAYVHPSGVIDCLNFSDGNVTVHGFGGHPPYSYSFDIFNGGTVSNSTGIFTGLPNLEAGYLKITDSCGTIGATNITKPGLAIEEFCAGRLITVYSFLFPNAIFSYDSITCTCIDCLPVQSGVLIPGINRVEFYNAVPGQYYNIIGITNQCGPDTFRANIMARPDTLEVSVQPINCHSFELSVYGGIDSVVYTDSTGTRVISHNGYFFDLPDGNYHIKVYGALTSNTCFVDSADIDVSIPLSITTSITLMMDSNCSIGFELSAFSSSGEKYFLINALIDTVGPDTIIDFGSTDVFQNLHLEHSYLLESDSGCVLPIYYPRPQITAFTNSYVYCEGLQHTYFSTDIKPDTFAYPSIGIFFYLDNIRVSPLSDTNGYEFIDTGWYTAKFFLSTDDYNNHIFPYDTICLFDSIKFYVANSHIPYPYPTNGFVCDSINYDTVYYHIYGGTIPYTIEFPGYDTVMLFSNTGIFPTHKPGTYLMIVYDQCGISRSIQFNVLDTCQGCPRAQLAAIDTVHCVSDTIRLASISLAAKVQQWYINNVLYSTAPDTFFIMPAVNCYILLRVVGNSGCADSQQVQITSISKDKFQLGKDTAYCEAFYRVLSTGIPSTVWSTGETGPQITVNVAGQYSAFVFNKCGLYADTINIGDTICPDYKIPDAFSPNGDGKNDVFEIPYLGLVYGFSLDIYNEWGGLIYHSADIKNGWDGTYQGVMQNAGIYTAFICITENDAAPERCSVHTITLIK